MTASSVCSDVARRPSAPWEWPLEPATALRVEAAPRPRWLVVTEGRAWLTESGAGPAGDDVWLERGQRQLLPAGSEWVAEGWPSARIELLEARPPRAFSAPSFSRWRVWPGSLRVA